MIAQVFSLISSVSDISRLIKERRLVIRNSSTLTGQGYGHEKGAINWTFEFTLKTTAYVFRSLIRGL